MKVSKLLTSVSLGGAVAILSVASTAYAWHPQGVISKQVQDVTSNNALVDANTANTALTVKPGDTVRYVVVVSNKGALGHGSQNDMAKTVFVDDLPVGVEQISNPSERHIVVNDGSIVAGSKVSKDILVKVTSTKDGDVIENKACFLGNSKVNDSPQSGCDSAFIKVSNPTTPVVTPPTTGGAGASTPTVTPKPQVLDAATTTLPNTGPVGTVAITVASVVVGYISWIVYSAKRAKYQNS